MERRILGLSTTAVRETGKIDDSFKNLGRLAAGAFAFAGLSELPQQLIRVRGEVQALEVAYTVLLGSKSKADAFLKQGIEFAAKTPFELDEIAKAQKLMLAYGFSVQSIIPTLTTLGDIAAGTGSNLLELVAAYGQIKTQGIAQQDDLNKLIERGINLTPELSRLLKVNESDIRQMVASGKIGFKEVEQAITSLVDGTGKLNFGGLMAEQAKSLTGLTSNLADAWKGMLNQIGKDNQDLLVSIISGATDIVESYEQILGPLKILIATYGAYKSAIALTAIVQAAANIAGNVQAWLSLATTIRSAKDAQIAFNLATSANPWVLAATAIIALTTAIIVYKKELTATQQIEQDLREARESANAQTDTERAKIEQLKTTINNEKLSRDARNKALRDLIALSPEHLSALTLDSIKTQAGTKSINEYVDALKRKYEQQELDRKFTESFQRESQAKAGKNEIGFVDKAMLYLSQAGSEGTFDAAKAITEQNRKLNADKAKQEQDYREQLKLEQQALDETANATVKAETTKQAVRAVTIKQLDEAISAHKEQLSLENSDAKNATIQRQINTLEAQRRRLTGEKTKSEKDADKVGPFGSISYYESISKKMDELIQKTPKTDIAKLNELNAKKLAADQQAEEVRKKLAVKSFDEELAEKQKQYELYTQWVEAYGKEASDRQFAGLIVSGQSYLDYLNTQIANLENERDNAGLTPGQTGNLGTLLDQRSNIVGKKTALDAFNEGLQKAQQEAGSLSDYLVILNQKQSELFDKKPISKEDFEIRRLVATEIVQTQQQLKDQLNQFLVNYAGSEQQQLAIKKQYDQLRSELDKRYVNNRGQEYKEGLDAINADEKQALEDFQRRQIEQTDEYKNTTKAILAEGEKRQKIEIERQQKLVDKIKSTIGTENELYREALAHLNELNNQAGGTGLQKIIGQYSSYIGQFGQALSQVGGSAGEVGNILVNLASNMDLVNKALKTGADKSQLYGTIIQGVVGIFSAITSAAEKRKKAETDYYQSLINQQQQYNLLLNEQLGLQTKSKGNAFVQDSIGELKDDINQYNDAQLKFQESLKKLQQGRAKEGLKDVLDSKSALELISSGAATGAAIGALVGGIAAPVTAVIGGLVGGIVGGITSLFGGATKKADEFGSLLALYPNLIQKSKDGVDELNVSLAQSLIDNNLLDDSTKALVQTTIEWQKQIDEAHQKITQVISTLAGSLGSDLRDALVGAFEDGTSSAQAFGDSVSKILDNLLSQLIFNQVFSKQFDQLQAELEASVGPNGDNNWVDDFGRFFGKADELTKLFNDGLASAQDAAKQYGLDIFKSTGSKASQGTALSGAIKGVTEETASVLAGQINAIRIGQASVNATMNQQLLALNRIDTNTARLEKTNELLDKMNGTINGLNDGLRAKGIL
ncbi:tape measure protein [Spirosoma sp. KCTC 42546]|uniref:tape measure protein n=1 Tax=Spirosoma sp. KCTC 42546 TaxID=2520506 RepID=UPI00143D9329|nr:tape measure protein [Spirosoma sp. KCTC 42546]